MDNLKISAGAGLFNARIKYFPLPDNSGFYAWDKIIFDRSVFNPDGLERFISTSENRFDEANDAAFGCPQDVENDVDDSNIRSFFRAKTKVFDYMMSNPDMNIFVTLTFSAEMVDRCSYKDIIDAMRCWLDNRVRRRGLKYLLVPEYHSDGRGIHFHGMMNNALELVSSGHKRKGKTVYNISDFPYGFTACIRRGGEVADVARVSKYIYKYMTKQGMVKIGGRFYLHGGRLASPRFLYYRADGFDGGTPVTLSCGLAFARAEISPDETLSRVSTDFFGNSLSCKIET